MRLAAIDIGSNAVRLLINDIHPWHEGGNDFTKLSFVRVPIRLGFDVFESGSISSNKTEILLETLKAFQLLMRVYKVDDYRICATSAMRDAANATQIIQHIYDKTGLIIQVLSGQEEAQMLYAAYPDVAQYPAQRHVYIDVGGGSTEISIYKQSTCILNKSFNVGTIRLLKCELAATEWQAMKQFVKDNLPVDLKSMAIGSGGNINKVFSLSKRKKDKPLDLELLHDYYKQLNELSVEDRMHHFDLRADRADVIVPALKIYTAIMRWGHIDKMLVPQIGLSDGIIHQLFEEKKGA